MNRDQLETFACVAEQRSFEQAAVKLSLTRGAVSQRIKALEESLSSVLLVRDKPVLPTPAGEILLRHVQSLRLLEGSTLRQLRGDVAAHAAVPVAIAVDAGSIASWLADALPPLLSTRRLSVEIIADNHGHLVHLKRGEVIGCVAVSAQTSSGFVAEALGEMEYRCVASPGFASEHFARGWHVPAVMAAPAIVFNRSAAGLHDQFLLHLFGFRIERYIRHSIPDSRPLVQAITSGCGYGLLPSVRAQPLIESGQLVDLAPAHPVLVPLHWHRWDAEPAPTREISRLLVEHARRLLAATASPREGPVGRGQPAMS